MYFQPDIISQTEGAVTSTIGTVGACLSSGFLVLRLSVCFSTSSFGGDLEPLAKDHEQSLGGMLESYTRVYPGTKGPFLKPIVGTDNYNKDMMSLGRAEAFTSFLLAHPDKLSGKMLVAILSTSDDFSVGVGSTRSEVLRTWSPTKTLQSRRPR